MSYGFPRAETSNSLKLQASEEIGPGQYESAKSSIKKSRRPNTVAFGVSSQRDRKKSSDLPGPGEYEYWQKPTSSHAKSVKIPFAAKAKRFTNRYEEAPGPGSHDVKRWDGTKRPYSSQQSSKIQPRRHQKHDHTKPTIPTTELELGYEENEYGDLIPIPTEHGKRQQPGPGSYLPNENCYKPKSPAYSQSRTSREAYLSSRENIPPPGSYNPEFRPTTASDHNLSSGFSSTRSRTQFGKRDKVPGPGRYLNEETAYNDGFHRAKSSHKGQFRGFSGAQRFRDDDVWKSNLTPGPGQYTPKVGSRRPETTGSNRLKDLIGEVTGIKNHGGAKNDSSRPFSSSDVRFRQRDVTRAPGPGTYQQELPKTRVIHRFAPAFNVADNRFKSGKKDSKENTGPAPGTYEHDVNPQRSQGRRKRSSWMFNSGQRRSTKLAGGDKDIESGEPHSVELPWLRRSHNVRQQTGNGMMSSGPQDRFNKQAVGPFNLNDPSASTSPGPGNYIRHGTYATGRGGKLDRQERFQPRVTDENVAPGAYEIQQPWGKPTFNMTIAESQLRAKHRMAQSIRATKLKKRLT